MSIQQRANKVIGVLNKYEGIQATKAVLEVMGFEVGDATFPMKAYSPEMKKKIFNEAIAAGLGEIVK